MCVCVSPLEILAVVCYLEFALDPSERHDEIVISKLYFVGLFLLVFWCYFLLLLFYYYYFLGWFSFGN